MIDLNADLLFGAGNVAGFIGVETRKVYNWMDRRKAGKTAPPVFDVGGQVCARRTELSNWFSGYREMSSPVSPIDGETGVENADCRVIPSKSSKTTAGRRKRRGSKSEHSEELRE